MDKQNIKVDIREQSVYIEIGDYTYYLDDSTGERLAMMWNTKNPDESYYADWKVQD